MGLTFTLTIFQGMFNCMTVQPVMAAERTVFYRERAASYYSAVPYTMVRGIHCQLPSCVQFRVSCSRIRSRPATVPCRRRRAWWSCPTCWCRRS